MCERASKQTPDLKILPRPPVLKFLDPPLVIWLKYSRYDVKANQSINQSINQVRLPHQPLLLVGIYIFLYFYNAGHVFVKHLITTFATFVNIHTLN